MLKNILNLEGAQQLSKKEQQDINGGWIVRPACSGGPCNNGTMFSGCPNWDSCIL